MTVPGRLAIVDDQPRARAAQRRHVAAEAGMVVR